MNQIKVNFDRLIKDLEQLGKIGLDEHGGISRPSFSLPDLEARKWFRQRIEEAGLVCRQDGAGNMFGCLPGASNKVVMAGSHLDTVINGGVITARLAFWQLLSVSGESKKRISVWIRRWKSFLLLTKKATWLEIFWEAGLLLARFRRKNSRTAGLNSVTL